MTQDKLYSYCLQIFIVIPVLHNDTAQYVQAYQRHSAPTVETWLGTKSL